MEEITLWNKYDVLFNSLCNNEMKFWILTLMLSPVGISLVESEQMSEMKGNGQGGAKCSF